MADISGIARQEAARRDGRADDGLQARARRDRTATIDAALRLIRERGQAQALKRADRSTSEGLVGYRLAEDGSKAAMVAVGCETEPVSKNEEFQAFAKKVLDIVDEKGAGAESELDEERTRSSRSSARTSSSSATRALRGDERRVHLTRTRTRRRTSSACSCR